MNKLLSLLLFAAACYLFGWAHAVLVPSRWHIALLAYGGSLAILVIREFLPRQQIQERNRRAVEILALIAVFITALFFRMSYVYSVPLGFHDEVFSQHLSFADMLITKGFIYLPMWKWCSTLHGYIVALIWKIFGESLSSFRLYLAFVAIVSCGVMFWWMRRLFGIREALLGGILLATAPYHQYMGRSGCHLFYLPLFAMLLFGVLFIMTQSNRKISMAVLASIVIVLGVHAYWVFCLEIAAIPIFILYCVITERGFLGKNWLALSLLVLLSAVLLIPLASFYYQHHAYIIRQFAKSGNQTRMHMYLENLKNCYYTYSASPVAPKYIERTPVAHKAFLIAGGIGFFLCLVRFVKSRAHALIVILFISHLAGLTVTKAIFWYTFQLLIFWIAFAAVAVAEAWKLLDGCVAFRGLKIGVSALFVAFLAISSWVDYRYYFGTFMIISPRMDPRSLNAAAIYSIEDIRASMENFDVYLPGNESGKDIGSSIFQTGGYLTEYKCILSAKTIMTNSIFFPGAPSKEGRGIMAYLPPARFWTEVAIPRLKALYPNMQVMKILPPAPWPPNDKQMLLKLVIPYEDLLSRKRLKAELSEADEWSAKGYFVAEKPGYYSFKCDKECEVEVGGTAADMPVLLSDGPVVLKVSCDDSSEPEFHIFFNGAGNDSVEIRNSLFNAPPSAEELIAPCLSRTAVPDRFAYVAQNSYDLAKVGLGEPDDAVVVNGTIYYVNSDGTLVMLNADLSIKRNFILGAHGKYRLLVSPSGQVWVYMKGSNTIYVVDKDKGPVPVRLGKESIIQALDFGKDGSLYALLKGKLFIYADGKWENPMRELSLAAVPPEKLPLEPYGMAAGPNGEIAILDGERQELIIFNNDGKVMERSAIPYLWPDSFVKDDPEGNWHTLISPNPSSYLCLPRDCIYDSNLRPVLNPKNGWTKSISPKGAKQSFGTANRFHVLPNGDLSFVTGNAINYMRRVPITVVGGSETEKGSQLR